MKPLYLVVYSLLLMSPLCLAEFKIALVMDRGGKDDKSFNRSAYDGAMEAKGKHKDKVALKYVEATDDNAFEPLLRGFAQKKFDLILAIGFSQAEAVKKVAAQYPNTHFAIFDAEVKAPNIQSNIFNEHEGSFLVGAAAALVSKEKQAKVGQGQNKPAKIGFIGGMDIPLIRRFALGYASGAKAVDPKVEVISNYIGVTAEAWNNPPKAKELALSQYEMGVDVIYTAAGASGDGTFDAAEEKKKFAIGVDANQNWVKPGIVVTSMVKRVDMAVKKTCEDAIQGKFTSGLNVYGLANHGIDYAVDQYNEKVLSLAVRKRVDELKSDIIAGKVLVPDFYKTRR